MLIDMHAHLWKGHYEEDKREIQKIASAYGVDRIYISSLGGYHPDEAEIRELNGATAQFMREQPQLIRGYCYVNPRLKNALWTLRHGIEDQRMAGMKLWVASFCDDPLTFPLVEQCIRYRVPILIHAFYKAVDQLPDESLGANVARLAVRYPEAKIMMAHLGANCYTELKPVAGLPNVSADISGSLFRRDEIDYAARMLGAGRLLFGTDIPGANFLVNYGQVAESSLTAEEKEMIFHRNAEKLFDRAI